MYIKNRRNRSKIKSCGSYQALCLSKKFGASESPTFHILTVITYSRPYMRAILDLKHWQIFIILLLPAFIPYNNPIVYKVISTLCFSFFFLWMYSIVAVLSKNVLKDEKPKANYYNFSYLLIIFFYSTIAFTTDYGLQINSRNYTVYGIWLWPLIILILLVLWSIMYIFYFTARTISLSNIKITGTNDSITTNYFFAFLFNVFGVWIIQPKIQELLLQHEVALTERISQTQDSNL